MLPFLKPERMGAIIISKRKPEGGVESEAEMDQGGDTKDPILDGVSEDLIRAVHAKDVAAVGAALKAAFEMFDAQPHVEGEHE